MECHSSLKLITIQDNVRASLICVDHDEVISNQRAFYRILVYESANRWIPFNVFTGK